MKNINIKIDDYLHEKLKKKCKEEEIKMNKAVPAMIEYCLDIDVKIVSKVVMDK